MLGTVLSQRYQLVQSLGRGSMGQVFLAQDHGASNQFVVVKLMHDHIVKQPRFRQLFEREIQTMRHLKHPYIVQMLDAYLESPLGPFIVMEYVPGVSLEHYLQIKRVLTVDQVCDVLGPLTLALQYAHSGGVIHRDLKPANMMVASPEQLRPSLKVMDFGLAALGAKPHISLEKLRGNNQVFAVGTPIYLCPEQIRGDDVDHRGDLYSVGVILYEMFTGYPPFDYEDVGRLVQAHVSETPPPMRAKFAQHAVPPAVEKVVMLCLAKYPSERPGDANALAELFSQAVGRDIQAPWRLKNEVPFSPPKTVDETPPVAKEDPYTVVHHLQAWMPERIAVVKLRGFLDDHAAQIVASEPGLIRLRIGPADTSSGWFSWLFGRSSAHIPRVDVEIHMTRHFSTETVINLNASASTILKQSNQLDITVMFRPAGKYRPRQLSDWCNYCDRLFHQLRGYLIVGG